MFHASYTKVWCILYKSLFLLTTYYVPEAVLLFLVFIHLHEPPHMFCENWTLERGLCPF